MSLLSRLYSFVRALVSGRRLESEIEADLRFHAEERADDLVRHGFDRAEAVRRARLELGDPVKWREDAREARGLRLLDELQADLRYGLRWLGRSPAFAATAVLSLALGIGANAAMFNLIDVVLLRSLPVRDPDRLVVLSMVTSSPGYAFSYRMFTALREGSATLDDLTASAPLRMSFDTGEPGGATVAGQLASGNYYRVLGVPAARGRVLEPEDDAAVGAGAVAVLSYGFWQRRFGADTSVLGKVVRLNGVPVTIVGVSAPEFFGTHVGEAVDVTVPLAMQPAIMSEPLPGRIGGTAVFDYWLELVGRLKPGVTTHAAQAETAGIFQPIVDESIRMAGPKAKLLGHPTLVLEPGSRGLSELRRRFSTPLLVLMAAVVLVLLIACANTANLLLARSAGRRRELAVRASLGAGRARLVRQLLVESLLLAGIGGAAGLALAYATSQALAGLLVDGRDAALAAVPNLRVLAFTFAASLVTGVLFGLAPALGSSRVDTSEALKEGVRPAAARSRFGVRGLVVSGQVAISLVLLVCAALFIRTLVNLRHVELGMDQEHVLTLRLEPSGSNQKRQVEPRLRQIYGTVLDRVQRVPGVRAASLAGVTPLGSENPLRPELSIAGYVPRAGEDMHIRLIQVYPGYLAALGVPLLAGRDLADSDNLPDSPPAVVINLAMARRFFGPPASALGQTYQNCIGTLCGSDVYRIVGVAADTRDRSLREEVLPLAYGSFARTNTGRGQMTLIVRTAGDPHALAGTVRQLAHEADPAMPMLEVQTLEDRIRASSRQEEIVAILSGLFGLIAVVLATVGLYGMLAYSVARRQPEFGVRLALGATPGGLQRLVIGESCALVVVGVACGLGGAVAAARSIAHMLYGLMPFDAVSFGLAAGALVVVALAAAWLPARHAAHTDPIVALRQE